MKLPDKDHKEQAGIYLLKKSETIATAESVTAGKLQNMLSNIKDAAGFFQGGITVYNVPQKYRHLLVAPIHALAVNGVSQQVANEMALNVCNLFGSNWGIAVTGYASPVPESGNKLYAYYSIVYNGKVKAKGKLNAASTSPEAVQEYFADTILKRLVNAFKK